MARGEGSRGGVIIGHTPSGKPVYASHGQAGGKRPQRSAPPHGDDGRKAQATAKRFQDYKQSAKQQAKARIASKDRQKGPPSTAQTKEGDIVHVIRRGRSSVTRGHIGKVVKRTKERVHVQLPSGDVHEFHHRELQYAKSGLVADAADFLTEFFKAKKPNSEKKQRGAIAGARKQRTVKKRSKSGKVTSRLAWFVKQANGKWKEETKGRKKGAPKPEAQEMSPEEEEKKRKEKALSDTLKKAYGKSGSPDKFVKDNAARFKDAVGGTDKNLEVALKEYARAKDRYDNMLAGSLTDEQEKDRKLRAVRFVHDTIKKQESGRGKGRDGSVHRKEDARTAAGATASTDGDGTDNGRGKGGRGNKAEKRKEPEIVTRRAELTQKADQTLIDERLRNLKNADGTPGMQEHQKQAAALMLASSERGEHFLLGDGTGCGKQLPVDTKVLTLNGWVEIGSIKIGDFVIGSNGASVRVDGVFPQGVKPSYRMWFSDGSSVESGPEHLWTFAYLCGGKRWEELRLTTEEVTNGDTIDLEWPDLGPYPKRTKLNLGSVDLYLPMLSAPVEFEGAGSLPIPAYLLGQLISNGALSNGSSSLSVNAADWSEIIERIASDGSEHGSVRHYGNVVRCSSFLGIAGKIKELGLNVLSGEKFIPDVYKYAAVKDRIALLNGLMDGDGTISKSGCRMSYSTTSRRLAEDFRELAECLGCRATVREQDRREKGIEFSVSIRVPSYIGCPFSTSRKSERYLPKNKAHPTRTFVRSEYVREVESVCISVEAEDALYCTEHAILTHNTTAILAYASTLSAKSNKPVLVVTQNRNIIRGNIENDATRMGVSVNLDLEKPSGVTYCTYDDIKRGKINLDVTGEGKPFAGVVFDEAQEIKNFRARLPKGGLNLKESAAARAAFALQDSCDHVVFSTATPLDKTDNVLYLASAIGMTPVQLVSQLGYRIVETKAGVRLRQMKDPVTKLPLMSPEQRKAVIDNMFAGMTSKGNMVQREAVNPYGFDRDVKTFKLSTDQLREVEQAVVKYKSSKSAFAMMAQRRIIEKYKVKQAVAMAKKTIKEGGQAVIYFDNITDSPTGVRKSSLAALRAYFPDAGVITGSTGKKNTVRAMHDFQSGNTNVVLVQSAYSAGISLDDRVGDKPRHMIIMSPPLAAVEAVQMEGRIDRNSTRSKAKFTYMASDHFSDAWVMDMIQDKVGTLGAAVKGKPEGYRLTEQYSQGIREQ